MAKFMNAELIAIRDNLTCGHCEAIFQGSDSQAWKVKYEQRTVYCGTTCRGAATRKRLVKPPIEREPCPTCGQPFTSKNKDKIYCSMPCYVTSPRFQEVRAQATEAARGVDARIKLAETLRTGSYAPCLDCGEPVYSKRQRRRKYCSSRCYRSYMAKRFDRWVANPEGMALPQCYDEFLDQEVLPCVVDGCTWTGKHLTLHVNQAHGLPACEFKRATGFNVGTGVISKDLAERLAARPLIGMALIGAPGPAAYEASLATRRGIKAYVSKESVEHRRKARALSLDGAGPMRQCKGCASAFQQSTPFGRAKYCSIPCRDQHYRQTRQGVTRHEQKGTDKGATE